MPADWSALTLFLRGKRDRITLSWQELSDIVGELPASARNHSAWWSGDRTHTRAWRAAGYEIAEKRPGVAVTFQRIGSPVVPSLGPSTPAGTPALSVADSRRARRILLVSCGKAKLSKPAAAKDLYGSPRFRKARAYAEQVGDAWFILSAEHGLVAPDEWLAPYERYLPDTPREYRRAWGEWVVARLALLEGRLDRSVVEMHAAEAYVQPIASSLERLGARIERPLQGVTAGRWQSWYDSKGTLASPEPEGQPAFVGDLAPVVSWLSDVRHSYARGELAALERVHLDGSGLYSWFVDGQGARELSVGLGFFVPEGLIYVGQTGATKWPSGKPSGSTLLDRLLSQHFKGRRSASTLRRTLGGVLDATFDRVLLREELSDWMSTHLRVVPLLIEDADTLGDLERQVVELLDPPLNLEHASTRPLRVELRRLRAKGASSAVD